MSFSYPIGSVRYTFASLADLLAKATPLRSGDVLAGVAAESAEHRVAAQFALADVPLAHFLSLASRLAETGRTPVLLLGPQERDRAEELARLAPDNLLLDFTRFPAEIEPLDGAIAVAQRLAVVVANDSGQGHLFGAAGRPIVSLFGPTDPARWRPLGPAVQIVRHQSLDQLWLFDFTGNGLRGFDNGGDVQLLNGGIHRLGSRMPLGSGQAGVP